MTNPYESIAKGLEEAIGHVSGKQNNARVHRPAQVDVAKLRQRLGMTQMEFAATFCISVATLRHWERGDRQPHGPALVLLNVVDKEPSAVIRALR
ncbi:helix-turn-helix domain-containing protein [Pseudidiomarina salilacus]|uniref:helix-turn-helix domain-containing protein n=1 Tax=Pseudidiomarina salilacus TaxID=3384452 RepID=UPI003984BBC7